MSDAWDTQQRMRTALAVMAVSVAGSILLAVAAGSAETNPGFFWLGLSSVVTASWSIVLTGALVIARRSSRPLASARHVAAWTAGLAVATLVGIAVGGHGADSWCADEGFARSQGFGQSLSLSGWPPGVRCALTDDGNRVEVYWPIDW